VSEKVVLGHLGHAGLVAGELHEIVDVDFGGF
jgi:hypothetical protein